jgi:hypothetical protein
MSVVIVCSEVGHSQSSNLTTFNYVLSFVGSTFPSVKTALQNVQRLRKRKPLYRIMFAKMLLIPEIQFHQQFSWLWPASLEVDVFWDDMM